MSSKSTNKTIKNYDKHARQYHEDVTSESNGVYHAYYEKPALRSLLSNLTGLSIMSFGCGSGADLYLAKEQNPAKIIGVDPSAELLKIAKKNHPDVQFIHATADEIDLPGESLDVIYSSLVMHYIEDWVSVMKKLKTLLKPGGVLIFSCAHPVESATNYGQVENDYKYALLGRKTHLSTDEQQIFGSYLGQNGSGIIKKNGQLGNIEIEIYHRSFSRMTSDINESGLQIQKILEPLPLPKMETVDKKAYDRVSHIPVFILFRLIKP